MAASGPRVLDSAYPADLASLLPDRLDRVLLVAAAGASIHGAELSFNPEDTFARVFSLSRQLVDGPGQSNPIRQLERALERVCRGTVLPGRSALDRVVLPRFRRILVGLFSLARSRCGGVASRSGSPVLIVYNTFAQFDTLCSGVLLALVMGWDRDRPMLARWLRLMQWPIYGAIAWVFSQKSLGQGDVWHRTWDYVWVWMCGVSLVVVAIWGNGWLRAVLSYSRIVWLGKISYGLYMYHEIALWLRKRIMYTSPWFANKEELFTIGTFALVIAMAAVSYYAYERRFLLWKRAWTRVPSRPV